MRRKCADKSAPPKLNFHRISRLNIFHNGRVSSGLAFGFHHCLLVATTTRSFILLELEIVRGGLVGIRAVEAKDLRSILSERSNKMAKVQLWDVDRVSASTLDLQSVIDKYHGKRYDLLHLNCRTFVNEICRKCSSAKRCGYLDDFLF